ncbi:hypothetical protein ACPOLB_08815 [Rubrivivax sp. RP6-9]|uniref:hypothetical protein n=1 Tax=Rubrivivax sp. RP6-9 TaxID=3415750 RepID=UPI003CC64D0A
MTTATAPCCLPTTLPLHRPWLQRVLADLADVAGRLLRRAHADAAVPAVAEVRGLEHLDARLRCDIGLCEGRAARRAESWNVAQMDRARW